MKETDVAIKIGTGIAPGIRLRTWHAHVLNSSHSPSPGLGQLLLLTWNTLDSRFDTYSVLHLDYTHFSIRSEGSMSRQPGVPRFPDAKPL